LTCVIFISKNGNIKLICDNIFMRAYYDLKRENNRQKEKFDKLRQKNNNFVKKYLNFVNRTA